MQLLERNDGKKWHLWSCTGRVGRENKKTTFLSFFNRLDAITAFEKKFATLTENKWLERDFFKAKLGKFAYFNEEKEKEKLQHALESEREVVSLLKKGGISGKDLEPTDDGKLELLRFVWDFGALKQVLNDSTLDDTKLPLGVLQIEKVKKCN